MHVAQMMISFFNRVEDIVEGGENAGNAFPQGFLKASFSGLLHFEISW